MSIESQKMDAVNRTALLFANAMVGIAQSATELDPEFKDAGLQSFTSGVSRAALILMESALALMEGYTRGDALGSPLPAAIASGLPEEMQKKLQEGWEEYVKRGGKIKPSDAG